MPSADPVFTLAVRTGRSRWRWGIPLAEIRVSAEGLALTQDGETTQVPFSDIAEIGLSSGGSWQKPIRFCRITLRGGECIAVTDQAPGNGQAGGDEFSAFVRAIHAACLAADAGTIEFTAGYSPFQYRVILACALALAGMLIVGSLVIAVRLGAWSAMTPAAAGAILLWPLAKMVRANRPRRFAPQAVPAELLSS